MRKIVTSFLPCLLLTLFYIIIYGKVNAQVPAFGPETFGTGTTLPAGWTVVDGGNDRNTWEMINTIYPSSGYFIPDASGGSHIKLDATASSTDLLYSPVIDCSNFTKGILRFGLWRAPGYDKTLLVNLDVDNNGTYTEFEYQLRPSQMTPAETWLLIEIDLKDFINNRPKVRLRFRQSSATMNSGPIRIDDVTLYGYTTTLPTDHFRTMASGNWNNTAVWESSHDNVWWIPATLTPTSVANTITIRSAHSVTNTSAVTVDQVTIYDGGVLTLAHTMALNDGTGDDLRVEEGGTLDVAVYSITGVGTIQLNGHLKIANPDGLTGGATTSLTTGIVLNAVGMNSIVEYNAMGNQPVSAQPTYANLVISGWGNKTLTGSTSVANSLKLKGGYLLLEAYNLLVGGTASGSSASYIKINGSGKLTVHGIAVSGKIFPIGNNSFNPVTITNGGGLAWTVGVEDNWVLSDPGLQTQGDKAVMRIWSVVPSVNPPPTPADVLFEYDEGDPSQLGARFDKSAPVQVWREADNEWLAAGTTQLPGGAANGTRTVALSQQAYFSRFAISNMQTPLPVRFRDVRAVQKQQNVVVYFTNETESEVDYYAVERSADGQVYKTMRELRPLKNNGTSVSYETADASPLEATNLYRVKARERNGKVTYSSVVRVNLKERSPRIVIVPNPAQKEDILMQLTNVPKDHYKMNLYNAKGQLVQEGYLPHPGGSAAYPLKVDHLQRGTYILELKAKEKLLQQFVIL